MIHCMINYTFERCKAALVMVFVVVFFTLVYVSKLRALVMKRYYDWFKIPYIMLNDKFLKYPERIRPIKTRGSAK